VQFSGARPEGALEAQLRAHIARSGARDSGMQDALLAALQALRQSAQGPAFDKAYRWRLPACLTAFKYLCKHVQR
jgi:hypothetical protein